MNQLLAGKTALITGATSGIGRSVALTFAREGARILATGRRKERLEVLANQIQEIGGVCHYLAGDGASLSFAQELGSFSEELGGVDILVCSAGIALRTPTLEMTPQEWEQVMAVNLTFPMFLSQQCVEFFLSRGGGKLVYISSTAAKNVNLGAGASMPMLFAPALWIQKSLTLGPMNIGPRWKPVSPLAAWAPPGYRKLCSVFGQLP